MLDHRFSILAAVITLTGSTGYALDTLRGRAQPNLVSWALWALAPLIAFAAELVEHAGLSSLLTFAVGFGPLMVTIAALTTKHARYAITQFDLACGALSLAALGAWAATGSGDVAILLSILSDLAAAIPTLLKARSHPQSESVKAFAGGAAGAALTLLTVTQWRFAEFGFSLYILLIDLMLMALLLGPRHRRPLTTRG